MSIFNVLSLIGGLALFLYGMTVMGDGLSKAAGSRMESILERLTSTPVKGVLLGAAVTGVIQSSSATTVMVVGFVNSGIMRLSQAVGIIMGANIGTTVTSWILSLTGIKSSNVFVNLLNPSSFSPVLAMAGMIMLLLSKSEKKHDIGTILLGFAVLMFGMETMSDAVSPLADVPAFTHLLLKFSNPILGLMAGLILTAIIQSSSASVGILQALTLTGTVTFGTAIPIIMGQNIGTCVTALISAIGAKKNAKRAAFIHLYFNIIGTMVFMIVFYSLNYFVHFSFLGQQATVAGIAIVHSSFNIITTMYLLPFNKQLVRLATATIRGEDETEADENEEVLYKKDLGLLEERFLENPGFAVAQCVAVTKEVAKLAQRALLLSTDLLLKYEVKKAKTVVALESAIDAYQDALGSYMIKLGRKPLTEKDNEKISLILPAVTNLERISDHAKNIAETARELNQQKMDFSDRGSEELAIYIRALKDIVTMATEALITMDAELAGHVEPLEEVIDNINEKTKKHHVKRLQKGKCSIELGMMMEDLFVNFERVADHCANIAAAIVETKEDTLDTHEYMDKLKKESAPEFLEDYHRYSDKYQV